MVGKGPWFYEIIDTVVTKMVSMLQQLNENETEESRMRCDYIIARD